MAKKKDIYQHKGTLKQVNLLLICPLDRPEGASKTKAAIYYYLNEPRIVRAMTQIEFNQIFRRPYTNTQMKIV